MKHRIPSPAVVGLLQWLQKRLAVRRHVEIRAGVHIGLGSLLWAPDRLVVEDGVYIGRLCTIECDGRIGRRSLIGNHVAFVGRHDHDWRVVGVPMAEAPWIGNADYHGQGRKYRVLIGPDVWVGHGAIILTGVSVGRGAIVAAGSVVTSDVEPYDIVAGNPAVTIGSRFDGGSICEHERLLRERWQIESN